MTTEWTVHCDGSAVPNPGCMGLGAVLIAPGGTRHELSQRAEGRGCNNEAEVRAVMAALKVAELQGATAILAYCDNSVVVGELMQTAARPVARLAEVFEEAREMLRGFEQAQVVWIPRHRNREADALARAALGLPPKAAAAQTRRRR